MIKDVHGNNLVPSNVAAPMTERRGSGRTSACGRSHVRSRVAARQ